MKDWRTFLYIRIFARYALALHCIQADSAYKKQFVKYKHFFIAHTMVSKHKGVHEIESNRNCKKVR